MEKENKLVITCLYLSDTHSAEDRINISKNTVHQCRSYSVQNYYRAFISIYIFFNIQTIKRIEEILMQYPGRRSFQVNFSMAA